MRCTRVRNRLLSGVLSERHRRHLESCAPCAAFAARLAASVETLRAHRTEVSPDAAFAARVVARLPRPTPLFGWAACRLLPAAAALMLVLSVWAWLGTAAPSEMVVSGPTDDVVSWVLANGESER